MNSFSSLSDDEVDTIILSKVMSRQLKAARIMADVMSEYDSWSSEVEEKILQRLISLADAGKIISFGDLNSPRFSEVCLPN